MDSLLQATLPPGSSEDEVDTYEALALLGQATGSSRYNFPV